VHPAQHACWAVASLTANLDHTLIWHLAATALQSQKTTIMFSCQSAPGVERRKPQHCRPQTTDQVSGFWITKADWLRHAAAAMTRCSND
jgi:hypothetical protein